MAGAVVQHIENLPLVLVLVVFPGPFWWRATKIPYTYHRVRGDIHAKILDLHKKYGAEVRISPTDISSVDGTVWKDVWGHRNGHAEFMKQVAGAPPNGVYGILGADRQDHARFRRLLSHAFSERGLREQEPRITYYVDLLIQGLKECSTKGSLDVVSWFNWTTFDIIGDLSFGESFYGLEKRDTHPWISSILGNLESLIWFSSMADYGIASLVTPFIPKRIARYQRENWAYTCEKAEQRISLGKDRGDFMDMVLKKDAKEGGMTTEEIKSNTSTLVLAGSETTATMLSGTMFALLSNPEILHKVQSEVRKEFQSEVAITMDSTAHLKYLWAVCEESMRVYPPVATFAARKVPAPGDTVADKYLPGGTKIHFVHYAAYNLEANFRRADEFLPERWLGDPEFANDNRAAFQPFSYGPRNCIGKNLAYAEMRLILARLLFAFDLKPGKGFDAKWRQNQQTFFIWQKGPLMVDLTTRNV